MGPPAARTLFIGLDACDASLAQEFAAAGHMPALARLMERGAVQETIGPLGWLVGASWPTIYTGATPSRHQFLCSGQVRGGTYEPTWLAPLTEPAPVWQWVSRAGGRVAVLDAPHAAVADELNGVQLVEWGCHDRNGGTRSYPRSLLADVDARYGRHFNAAPDIPFPHAAPCDYAHRDAAHRTIEQDRALLADILTSHERKRRVSADLLAQGDWSLFFTVFGETHCVGHQLWKYHDRAHPQHDACATAALGGDPLCAVYAEVDRSIDELVSAAGADATRYVLFSHGMAAHFDGAKLLDLVLWRIDDYASRRGERGIFTRTADKALGALPRSARRPALSALIDARRRLQSHHLPIGDSHPTAIPVWMGQRRWWMQPNDTVFGSVRLNVEGRERHGRIGSRAARDVALWLADRLYELVNVDTAEPAIANVYLTDDHYERVAGDPMGDLIVEWNRIAPIDRVWSPASGVVSLPYDGWRTGDHTTQGMLVAVGPGVAPGRRPGVVATADIAPTLAASLDIEPPPFVDGAARTDLLPVTARAKNASVVVAPRPPFAEPARPRVARSWARGYDVTLPDWTEEYAVGLSRSLHVEHEHRRRLEGELRDLRARVDTLDQLAQITEVGAWLAHTEVAPTLLISVVMPTRNRADRLARAIASVQAQTYPRFELLVVDDASTDGTPELLERVARDDERIRTFRLDAPSGSSTARNHALDYAKGDIVAYLDDDNAFDPGWLKAVAWVFTEHPETHVCYGARVIDDDARHQGLPGRSRPIVQFLPWDRDAMLHANLVDQNVIAHRPSVARFDPRIDHFSDWDLMLQLTDDTDPMPLPAIAVYYTSDLADRLSAKFTDPGFVADAMDAIRARTIARRSQA